MLPLNEVCTETITPVMEDEKFKDEPSSRHAAPPGPDELMNTTITDWGAVTLKSGSVDTFDEGRSSSAWPWRQTSPVKRRLLRLSETVASYLTRELPSQRSPEAIRAISWSARINLYLSCPEETVIGWRLNQLILLVLFVNIAIMSSETLDGPRYAGTDPDYPYMLRDSSYNSIEAFFTVIYCVEFAARWLSAPNQIQFWKGISTWVGLLAMTAAIPKLVGVAVGFNTRHADAFMYNLRILRVIRLIILSHAFVGTKVLLRAAQYSVAPLEITFFFLITVVMVFATAIFYAEPCYDLQTCTFTDIFNTGYFVMLTVATVGYGSQVPSIHNPGSLILTCIVMIFGTLYLSMPLAIIGIKYDLAWREYDEFAHNKSMEERRNRPLKEIAADVAAETKNQKLHHGNSSTPYADGAGHTLEKLEVRTVKYASSATCERFYELSKDIVDIHLAVQPLMSPITPAEPATLESLLQLTKRRSDEASRALDAVVAAMKLHKRVCADAHSLLLTKKPTERETGSERRLSSRIMSVFRRGSKEPSIDSSAPSSSKLKRAHSKIASLGSRAVESMTKTVKHSDPHSLRAIIWNIFDHRRDIWLARVVNKMRLYLVVLSIVMFYLQTTPELQKTGLQSVLCQRTVHDFCKTLKEPGCYVFEKVGGSGSNLTVAVTTERVNFNCKLGDPDERCYASGVNFGSVDFPLSCVEVFGSEAGTKVCKTRLCQSSTNTIFDMEPYWIYFEFFFGIVFTVEFILRAYAHPARRQLPGNFSAVVDVIILLPFYAEIVEIGIGEMPTYSIVPTIPSFFNAIRVLKTFRILKLGTHIPGARVLTKTAELTWRRLVIPLFFLFMGCVVSAAIFFELERGTECFVGNTCMWWHKNVLTPQLSEGLPMGKRVLVQNTLLTIITDMLRSTWFSLVSFTTVGYGDLYPRTSLGKLADIVGTIFSACYTAMPLTLVGGQFYICYEVYAKEEKRFKQAAGKLVKPEVAKDYPQPELIPNHLKGIASRTPENADQDESLPGQETAAPISIASLAAPVNLLPHEVHSPPKLSSRTSSKAGVVHEDKPDSSLNDAESTELQMINHFFLMHKVFNEMIEDLSSLNRLGTERVANGRRRSFAAGADSSISKFSEMRRREYAVESKISTNMVFCMTAYLNFASMIERILGTKAKRTLRLHNAHTDALLPASELELATDDPGEFDHSDIVESDAVQIDLSVDTEVTR